MELKIKLKVNLMYIYQMKLPFLVYSYIVPYKQFPIYKAFQIKQNAKIHPQEFFVSVCTINIP